MIPDGLAILVGAKPFGPMLCGFIKPAILLPKNVLYHSKPDCIASILAHETAHFLRKDIYFNLGQSVLEALCFFHPAVKWLSREIRIEREMACDDLAVEMLEGNRLNYASALLETEYQTNGGLLTAAFGIESTSDRAVRIAFGEKDVRRPIPVC